MYRGLPAHFVRLLACVMAVAFLGCASAGAKTTPGPSQIPSRLINSPSVGLVGLLLMDPLAGPPRAAGMKGVIVGYVVSHPSLQSDLSVRTTAGHALPVLAFKLALVIVRSNGAGGLEDLHGRGTLNIYYKPDGFSDELLNYAGAIESNQRIESDHIEFQGYLNFNTYRLYLQMREVTVATSPFTFAGRSWRTPVARIARDVLIGEYSDSFFGLAIASSNAMVPLSPEEKLVALVGSPQRVVRY